MQGPINRFFALKAEFFTLQDAQFAIQRILWGMIKKLVIADRVAQVVHYTFKEYEKLPCFVAADGLVLHSV